MSVVKIKPVNVQSIKMKIEGTTSLIQHKWSEKALREMREKHAGKKTKNREARDPEAEATEATYFTEDGTYGIPLTALKSSIIGAAHKDLGIEKTLVRKALFIPCHDRNELLEMQCAPPVVREDYVRVGMGSTDLRYRPEFSQWAVEFQLDYDADLLSVDDIVNLINRAGFGIGIGEWRPEKGGDHGRFKVV